MGKVAERTNVGSCRKPTFGETGGNDGFVPNVIIWLFAGEMNERRVSGNAIGPLNDRIWASFPTLHALRGRAASPTGLHAVFVHSRPQVSWTRPDGSRGRCELADLLLVVDHKGPGTQKERRAVLIQAKLLKGGEIKLRGKEWTQYELLSEWPAFDFVTPGYAPAARNFLDESVCENAQNSGEYGGIDLKARPPLCVQEMVAPPRTTGGRISLGQLLVGMTRGSDAMGREAHIGGADDWSSTVDELLRVTAALPITIASAVRRGHSHSLGMLVAQASYGQMPSLSAAATRRDGPPSKFAEDDDNPGGPISIVRLTLQTPSTLKEREPDRSIFDRGAGSTDVPWIEHHRIA